MPPPLLIGTGGGGGGAMCELKQWTLTSSIIIKSFLFSSFPSSPVPSRNLFLRRLYFFSIPVWYSGSLKDLMQRKLFQRCTHLLYCSVLSLCGNVNTRRMSKPDMGSIFHINNHWTILVKGNYYVNYQNYQNSMLVTSSDTKRTLRHLFLFTNSAHERTGFNM